MLHKKYFLFIVFFRFNPCVGAEKLYSYPEPTFHFDSGPEPTFHFDSYPEPTFHFDSGPEPTFHFDSGPEPTFHIDSGPETTFHFDSGPEPTFHFDSGSDSDQNHLHFKWQILFNFFNFLHGQKIVSVCCLHL